MGAPDFTSRLRHVKRWGIVHTATTQSVAEHAGLVAIYVTRILALADLRVDPDTRALMLEWALWHDMPEVYTGDIPTPFKHSLGKSAIHKAENMVCPEHADLLRRVLAHPHSKTILAVVKLADIVEAVLYLQTDGLGAQAAAVKSELQNLMVDAAQVLYDLTGASAVYAMTRLTGWPDQE